MSEEQVQEQEVDRSHLQVDDGCGCAEVWEHLSDRRAEEVERAEAAASGADDADAESD